MPVSGVTPSFIMTRIWGPGTEEHASTVRCISMDNKKGWKANVGSYIGIVYSPRRMQAGKIQTSD